VQEHKHTKQKDAMIVRIVFMDLNTIEDGMCAKKTNKKGPQTHV